jgi:hypothetical protein
MADSGQEQGRRWVSKTTMLVGAAGLFLFIVGVKRKHRLDAEREVGFETERRERERRERE